MAIIATSQQVRSDQECIDPSHVSISHATIITVSNRQQNKALYLISMKVSHLKDELW